MEPQILRAEIQALLANSPDFSTYTPQSRIHQEWLGRAHALVLRWNEFEAAKFRVAADWLSLPSARQRSIAQIFGALHRAIGDLELRFPAVRTDQAFGPGAVYDFFKALNSIIESASTALFIIDPYMDDGIFDRYLSSLAPDISVRLLIARYPAKVRAAAHSFSAQHGNQIEARESSAIHDRLIFVDSGACWVLGQSIKDAATTKATYLAPLSSDVSALKLEHYEQIWKAAKPV